MGDRGNIKLTGGSNFPTPVFFYTHWSGSGLKSALAAALEKGKSRWDDPSYLGRVIFDGLRGDDNGVTGYGISSVIQDNQHPILVVDMDKKTVHEETEEGKTVKEPILFAEFLQQESA